MKGVVSAPRRSLATSRNGRGCWRRRTSRRPTPKSSASARWPRPLDQEAIVQQVTDAATELTHAEFGAFFYNVIDRRIRRSLHALHLVGCAREAFAKFPQPRATAVFAPTFHGEGRSGWPTSPRIRDTERTRRITACRKAICRCAVILRCPSRARPATCWADCSLVIARWVFTEQHEQLAIGIAAWASVALENARLYREAQGRGSVEGRIPRRPVARTADAAECDRRLLAPAARRDSVGRQGVARSRDPRTKCDFVDTDRRGRPGHFTHRVRQDPSRRSTGGAAAHRPQRRGHGAAGCRREGRPGPDHHRSHMSVRSRAIPIDCSRSSGIFCRMR